MRKADKNKDNKMSFKELQNFLKELNIQVDDNYARKIFRVRQEAWWVVRQRGPCPNQMGSEPGFAGMRPLPD